MPNDYDIDCNNDIQQMQYQLHTFIPYINAEALQYNYIFTQLHATILAQIVLVQYRY